MQMSRMIKKCEDDFPGKGGTARMYIHIGGTYAVSDKYILGVFDFDGTTLPGSDTIAYLRKAELEDRVESVSPDLPRSFIVTLDRVYYSPIAAATIRRRMERAGDAIKSGNWLHEDQTVASNNTNYTAKQNSC
jgi:hypothetical protein